MALDFNAMNRRERTLVGKLLEALVCAQSLSELVRSTEEFLTQLTSADCMALCASKLGQPTREDWLVAKMPSVYFDHYADWKKDDLIRDANMKQPNVVLRDADIIARKDLVNTSVYRIGHDMNVPLEQVVSVYLTASGWEGNGGFSAYRLKPRPFSDRERNIIQHITPMLQRVIQRCQVFVEHELTGRLLETQTEAQRSAVLVLVEPGEEVRSVGPISALMRKWFRTSLYAPSGLPLPLVEKLTAAMKEPGRSETAMDFWEVEGDEENLRVTFIPIPPVNGKRYWNLRLQEVTQPMLISWLKLLSPKEVEIANLLSKGLSTKEISTAAHNSEETVKKQLKSIYRKLKPYGVSERKDFLAKAHLPSKRKR